MIRKDFFKLHENRLKHFLKNKDFFFEVPEYLDEKISGIIIKSADKKAEFKPKYGFSVLRPAFAFGFIIILFISFFTVFIIHGRLADKNLNKCTAKQISGASYVIDANNNKKTVQTGISIKEGSALQTALNSSVELEIKDNSKITINENSEIKILKLFKDNKVKKTGIRMTKGVIDIDTGILYKGSSIDIETISALIGVKGTDFSIFVNNEHDVKIKVRQGSVFIQPIIDTELLSLNNNLERNSYDKLNVILNQQIIIKNDEWLEINYQNYLFILNQLSYLLNKIKTESDMHTNYTIDESDLLKIKKTREQIINTADRNENIINNNEIKENIISYENKSTADNKINNEKKPDEKINSIEFFENFDNLRSSDIPAGWQHNNNGKDLFAGAADSTVTAPHSAPNCFRLYDNNTKDASIISKEIGNHNYGQIKFYFKLNKDNILIFYLKDQSGSNIIDIGFTGDKNISKGTIHSKNNNLKDYIGYFEFDKWNETVIKYDKASGYFNISCNGNNLGTYTFDTKTAPFKILFLGGRIDPSSDLNKNITAYIDDIEFTADKKSVKQP